MTIPQKEIEALKWLIAQRFLVKETDNAQFWLVLSLLGRLSRYEQSTTVEGFQKRI